MPMLKHFTTTKNKLLYLYLLSLILIPPLSIELYPYTISPMFRDSPEGYITIEAYDALQNKIPLKKLQLHQNYDGNPIGIGAGIKPHPTLLPYGKIINKDDIIKIIDLSIKRNIHALAQYKAKFTFVVKQYGSIDTKEFTLINQFKITR